MDINLARNLEIYFYNSQREMLQEAEQYLIDNPNEVNRIIQQNDTSDSVIRINSDFYGYNPRSPLTLDEQYTYDQIKSFSNMPLLEEALSSFEVIRKALDLGDDFDSARMKFTKSPRGVFNFGVASKGLYRKIEYYDETNDIIVDNNLVLTTDLGHKKECYYNFRGTKIYLRKQQEGTYYIEKNCDNITVKYSDEIKLFLPYKDGKIYNGCGKVIDKDKNIYAKLKYATTTQKVYMYREKLGGGVAPYVDLFVVVGGLGDLDTENMLAKNLPVFIVADILEKAGVKVRIYGVRSYKKSGDIIFTPFAIKEYGESLDFNSLASFTSDKRFFRVNLWRTMQALRRKRYKEDDPNSTFFPQGLGTTLYGIRNGQRDELYDVFQMYKNWVFANKGSVKNTTKINDKGLMILGGLRDIKSDDLLTGDNKDITYQKIEDEIYRILDYVGMILSKNPKKFIQKIYEREKVKPKYANPKREIMSYLAGLIRDNLQVVDFQSDDYKEYQTPPDEALRLEERTKDLVDIIQKTLM